MTQTPTPVYVVTTYNKTTLETDTAGAFTVLTAAKREAQRATQLLADTDPLLAYMYTVPIEEWHGPTFVAQHYIRGYTVTDPADTDADPAEAPVFYEWWVQPASGAPYRGGELVDDE